MKHDSLIPQYAEKALSYEQLAYKAGAGSYKACDALLSLLRFTTVAALGATAFDDLRVAELQQALHTSYLHYCQPLENKEAIAFAIRWAWPPMNNYWVSFEALELMQAVNGLCALLQHLPQEQSVQHLITAYACDSQPDEAYLELGQSLQQLGFARKILSSVATTAPQALWQGFDA